MKKIIIATLGLLLIVLLALIIIRLLGYHFNKDFISFNKQQCIKEEYPTYYHHSGIRGCVFWMRNDYLEKTQSWRDLFKKDEVYCSQKYKDENKSSFGNIIDAYLDPKCEYEAFKDQKRNENWAYLVSEEKDGFYNYCVDQICPSPKVFK